MKSKSLFSFMKNKFNVYAVSFLFQKKSWKWNCYLKAHTESFLWSLMTLTAPTLQLYWNPKFQKQKRNQYCRMFVHNGIQDWGMGVWICFWSLKWGFFSIWSYSIQSPCCWWNPPLHPWHLSIRSLAVGFALRVNKGGNLINMEANLARDSFCSLQLFI